MSEVLNAEVTSSEEGGLSRRRIVKGVAWSVPVIVTAIAAPAAAASPPPTFSIAFGPEAAITISKATGQGNTRSGKGPSKLDVQNNTGGSLTGTISITPTAASTGQVGAAIAVKTLTGATFGTFTFDNANASTATITLTGTTPADRTISFYYVDRSPAPVKEQIYTYTVTITVNGVTSTYPGFTMTIPK